MLQRKQLNVFRLKLLPLFLILLFTITILPVHATPTFVAIIPTSGNATAAQTLSNIRINDLLYVAGLVTGNSCGSTISDTLTNTWTLQACGQATQVGGCISLSLSIWTTISTSAGSDTVTTVNGAGIGTIFADYSGITSVGTAVSHSGTSATDTITVTQNQQGEIETTFALTNNAGCNNVVQAPTSGQTSRSTAGPGFSGMVADSLAVVTGSASYAVSFTAGGSIGWIHTLLPISGVAPQQNPISTLCFGNCGTPAVTVVNTNSTHSINFNQSITLFYEFQSNLNGVINNVTLNYAQICGSGNKCVANTLFIAAYSAGLCGSGVTPFAVGCVGSRLAQASFSPPTKARLSMQCPSNCVVVNGQWIAIAVSASFSGIDINDTNTNVPLFQTNGITPTTISQSSSASSNCAGCKMGLWAWITGNIVTGTTPPNVGGNCGNGIGDYISCLTLTFCTGTPNSGCQLAGGLFWSMIYSVVGIVGLMWIDHKFLGNDSNSSGVHVPATGYAFVPLGVQFMFIALGILPLWWGILLIMTLTIMFTSILLGILKSRQA